MTLDYFDTWWVFISQFVGVYSESGISCALNNVPEAQDSYYVRKITIEMGYENGTLQ